MAGNADTPPPRRVAGVVLALAALLAGWLTQPVSARPASSPAQAPLVVALSRDDTWLPFYRDAHGRPVGYDIERIRTLAEAIGAEVTVAYYPDWASAVQAVCQQKADVVLNVQITAARTQCLAFTQSWAAASFAIVSRGDRPLGASATTLRGRRIACEHGWESCTDIRRAYPAASIVDVTSTREALRAVAEGRADVYIGNAFIARQALAEGAPAGLAITSRAKLPDALLHDAVSAGRAELAVALDEAARGKAAPALAALREKWLKPIDWPTREPLEPTPAEAALLSRTWTVGVPEAWKPLAFVDAGGQIGGVVSEYLDRFRDLGVQVRTRGYATWTDMEDAMRRGEIDFVIGLPRDERRATPGWRTSEPFLSVPIVVVMRADVPSPLNLESLTGRRVVVSDVSRLGPLLQEQAPHLDIARAATLAKGLEAVDLGDADAYIGDLAAVDRAIRERYIGRQRVVMSADISDRLVLAARGDAQPLLGLFDRMVADIPPTEREAMQNHWFVVQYQQHGVPWRTLLTVVLPVGLVIVVALGIYGFGFWRLRREVAQRRVVERQLEEVAANLPAMVYQLERQANGTFRFIYVLGDVESVFGISRETMLADEREAFSRVHIDERDALSQAMEHAAEHFTSFEVEFRVTAPTGDRWFRSVANPIRSEHGNIVWNGYWVDVTAAHESAAVLRVARAEAEQATVAKAEFLATMSHEIRTPMSGLLGLVEMLGHSGLTPAQSGILETMGQSAHMLRQLLDDILDYSRIEKGALELEHEPVDIEVLVRGLHGTMLSLATRKDLRFAVRVDDELAPLLMGDGLRLQQVLSNLVSNAIKFTQKGTITLAVDVASNEGGAQRLIFAVIDTGIGITREAQGELFQPFRQAEGSTTRRFGGSGLGLSICRHLVSLMHGTIEMDSEPGEGTTVTVDVTLPIASPGATAGGKIRPAELTALPPGFRALIAEDHVVGQRVLRWRLAQLGISSHVVDDGLAALEILAYERFDVLITDCQMPVMDGYTLARKLRAREEALGLPRLPVIALTAGALPDQVERCHEAGMDFVLTKPVYQHVLHQTLAMAWADAPRRAATYEASLAATDAMGDGGSGSDFGMTASAALAHDMEALDAAIATGEIDAIRSAVHRLGGALGALGHVELATNARRLDAFLVGATDDLPDDYLIQWRHDVLKTLADM